MIENKVIGGRKWRYIERPTFERDTWIMPTARKHGLDQLKIAEHERPEDFAARILSEVIASGVAFLLLGGLMIPDELTDAEWTPQVAKESGEFFRLLQDPEDKDRARVMLVTAVTAFFIQGLSASDSSPSALTISRDPGAQPAPPQTDAERYDGNT